MKRFILLALTLMLLISGCAKQPEPTQAATEEITQATTIPEAEPETTPVPETVPASALAGNIPICLAELNRGDVVEVTGSINEDKVVVKLPEGYAVVNGSLLVPTDAEDYTEWTGYSTWSAKMYDNYHLLGTPVAELRSKSVQVIDELPNCYIVVFENQLGYAAKNEISRWKPSSGGSSDSGNGNNHGGSGNGGSNSGADGGDISLSAPFFVAKLSITSQAGAVTGKATVKANRVEAVLGYLQAGESVDVVTESGFAPDMEGYYTVMIDGLFAYVRKELLAMPDDAPYESWEGFSKYGCEINEGLYLDDTIIMKPAINTSVTVLQEFKDCFFVSVDGTNGFVAKDFISTVKTPVYSGSGNGNGGGSGGGNSNSEWSPPML